MKSIDIEIKVAASHYTKEGEYWLTKLAGELVKSSFPRDIKPGSEDQYGTGTLNYRFPDEVYSLLMKLRNGSDYRLFMVLVAGMAALLGKYTGNTDIILGSPIYRQEGESEAEFVNTVLPLRIQLEKNISFKDLLLQVRQTVIEADEHQNYPMETLLYKLGIPMSETDFPLFDVALLLENVHERKYLHAIKPRIIFSFNRTDDYIEVNVEYDSSRFFSSTVSRIASHLSCLLQKALENVNTPFVEIEVLSEQEKNQLLYEFNDTAVEFARDKTIHQMFEEQVERTPGNMALNTVDGAKISYAELNRKANRLAGYLKENGVTPDSIVGMMLDPSVDMVVGMLGILKAGGAYLPIDPGAPLERIIAMLKDSGARLLLTNLHITARYPYTSLQGLRDRLLTPHYTPRRKQIVDLNSLPIPNRAMVNYEEYNRFIGQVMVTDIISLQTARGCPYECAYCSKVWHKKHVFRSAENIFSELMVYYNMGVRRFSIFDDIFNINAENGKKFFKLIIDNNLDIQLFFPNGMRGDLLTKEYIDLAVRAGLVSTALALETASPRLQKLIKKNLDLDKFRENVEYFCEKYPHVILELFAIHGFPTETEKEAFMTLDFIKSLKWVHFPYLFILKIFPDTDMEKLALDNGVHREDILKCEDLALHEMSPTSPFKESFTKKFQSDFLHEYFLSKERLLHVLPYQLKVLTKDELIQKYDSYLPGDIKTFEDLLAYTGISEAELDFHGFLDSEAFKVPGFNQKLRDYFPAPNPAENALRVLFLDLSQYFSDVIDMLYDVVEPPLGAMYIMTYLEQQLGNRVHGKIAKSRIDFDSFAELKALLADFKPNVIALRSLTFYRDFFHTVVQVIRQWGVDVPIIAGGPYATRNPNTILQDKNIDLVVLLEGELTFCEIIEKIIENDGELPGDEVLQEITGIAYIPGRNASREKFAREMVFMDQLEDTPVQKLFSASVASRSVNRSSDTAYVIYTSGSTGRPKGVLVEHRNAVNVLQWFGRTYNLHCGTRVMQLTNYTFDPSVEQIFGSLLHGAEVYIGDKNLIADRDRFISFLDENRINILNFVPGALLELLGQGKRPRGLETLIAGGERLDETVKNALIAWGYRLYNQYGPTETTIDALMGECSLDGAVTLGHPIANVRCYILDKDDSVVPIGVPGELVISGAGVTRGYLNNPELTAEKFKGSYRSHRTYINYHTGDLARWLPGGKIEFLGRRDHQVKIRGYRVELGEIESLLKARKDVKDAVVIVMDDEDRNKFLCAYYVYNVTADEETVSSESDLRYYLESRLPEYMIPSRFITLKEFPLTSTGKIDRTALADPSMMGLGLESQHVSPQNETEEKIAEIWESVLGRKGIGITENFFTIGGDSIKAIQIVARMNKEGFKVKTRDIFRNPSIAALAPLVTHTLEGPVDQSIVTGTLSLTPSQIEFFELADVDSHHYNQAVMLYSEERLNLENLRIIFSQLQEHHDALRMTFKKDENGRVIQTNHHLDYPLSIEEHDLRDRRDMGEAREALTLKVNQIQSSIDMEKGPLMKVALFHLEDGDRLLIVIHHLVVDGVSWRILFEDIATLYRQLQAGEELVLPQKTNSFKQWTELLSQYAGGKAIQEEKVYWAQVESLPVPMIAKDYEGISNYIKDAEQQDCRLDKEETQRLLTEVNHAFGTEINDILLAAFGLAAWEIYGHQRLLIALEGHGREDIGGNVDISRTIGWFTSVYPVLLEISHPNDLARQVKEIKEQLRQVPNKGIGYGILKYLSPASFRAGIEFNKAPQISFNYLGQFDADVEKMAFQIAAESPGYTQGPERRREFELDITGWIGNQQLGFAIAYNKKQFSPDTIRRLLEVFKTKLTEIINFCSTREEKELTPSDFTYDKLSIDALESINALFNQ